MSDTSTTTVERMAVSMEREIRRITKIDDLKSNEAEMLRDLAKERDAARAEIERLTKERDEARAERDALMADPLYIIGVNHGWDEAVENDVAHPAARPMQSMLAAAERDMRQRAADYLQSAANDWRSDGHKHNAKKIEDEIPGVLALPLKYGE